MLFQEGDFIETFDGLIFDVKGLVHPPDKVIAFIRYIPDSTGDRMRNGKKFRKIYDLSERNNFLKMNYPEYLVYDNVFDETLNEVSNNKILTHYKPTKKRLEIQKSVYLKKEEKQTLEFINYIKDLSKISINKIGISGSILVGLSSRSSDIDVVIYGSKNCREVQAILNKLIHEREVLKPFNHNALAIRHLERNKESEISFDDYVFHELRKSFQGYYLEREFFVRYIKDSNEVKERYGDIKYKKRGYVKIVGSVIDDLEAIFTPCTYLLNNVKVINGKEYFPIKEIVSFRGRFCEQAKKGETVIAQGKLEQVRKNGNIHYRLLLGNTSKDFMITTH